MKAVITGGLGFVGRHLAAHLDDEGVEPIALDRIGDDPLDITDATDVRERFDAIRPEIVYHLAALSHVGESWDAPAMTLRVNAEGTLNVLLAAHAAGVRRVVVVGSSDEYGAVLPDELPVSEATRLRPNTPYAASKAAAEIIAQQHTRGGGVETVCVRAFNHTGPGQPDRFVIPAFATRIARAERDDADHILVGNLASERDFSDVRDVVRAYALAAARGAAGSVYNVCSGRARSMREIVELLIAESGRPLKLVDDPALMRPVDTPRIVGDASRLREATGWEPRIPLEETLRDVLADARASVAIGPRG